MERVIDIKLSDDLINSKGLDDIGREIYDIFVIDEKKVKRKIKMTLDNPKMQEYLRKFEKYLTIKKESVVSKALENTGMKRLRNNLLASPIYVVTLGGFLFSLMGIPEVIGIPIFLSSIVIGIPSAILVNKRSLYTNPEDEKNIRAIETKIVECQDLQKEIDEKLAIKEENQVVEKTEKKLEVRIIDVINKSSGSVRLTPERLHQLQIEAMMTKKQIERKTKFDFIDLYRRVDEIEKKINEKKRADYPRGNISDVPEYFYRSRR